MADFTRFPEAFSKAGIKYTEEPGWRNRGHGDIISFNFIVVHHTAGGGDAGDIRVVRDGVANLAGPLSQIVFKRDGTPHIIAAGVSWHAGYGNAMWGAPAGNGNYYSIGIEGVSNGRNDWTQAQRDNYPRVVAAILKEAGLPSDRWIFHRDYNKRDGKIDPVGFEAGWFANEVNRHYNSIGTLPPPTKTAIEGKRDENPWLGNKTTVEKELTCPDGVGKFAFYDNGAIYFTANTGAQSLNTDMVAKWASQGYEAGYLGYPINSTHDLDKTGKRRAQAFQGGSIYWSEANGAHYVGGAIGSKWAETGWEKGFLGMPVTDEIGLPDKVGILQAFEGGHIYYHPDSGAHTITGVIWDRFAKENYENIVGYPKTDQLNLPNRPGTFQMFTNGHIYEYAGKAYFVSRDFMYYYERLGYEAGRLGAVVDNKEFLGDDKWIQHFEGGSIEIDRKNQKARIEVSGQVVVV